MPSQHLKSMGAEEISRDEFLKILNTLGGENVFVISHKQDALADKFRQTIRFVKEKNFSHIG